jgi:hypothetical protein
MPERAKIRFPGRLRGLLLAGVLVVLLAAWAGFHSRINRALVTGLFLRAESPSEDTFLGLVGQSPDPATLLSRCWDTDKIPQRELVASYLKTTASANPS